MTEKRIFKALFKTVLFFSFLHLTLLIVLTIVSGRIAYLNVFEITGLSHFFPGMENGLVSFIVSGAIILAVYLGFYAKHKNKS